MGNRNYENSITVEGNIFYDPDFYFIEHEGKDICKLTIANNFYPAENEKEVNYFIVRIYSKKLINMVKKDMKEAAESGINYKGRRVRVIGRLRQIREGEGNPPDIKSRIIIVGERLEFLANKLNGGLFMEQSNKRVRINVSTTAKGLVQWGATAEFETVEETKVNLAEAIKAVREVIREQGLKEAEATS